MIKSAATGRVLVRILVALAVLVGGSVASSAAFATAPITATPTSIAFGSAHLGVTVTKPLSVRVAAGLTISHLQSYGGAPFAVQAVAPSCSSPGPVTCTLQVTFRPIATGPVSGSVWFVTCSTSTGSDCTSSFVNLTGTGVAPGSNAAIAFGPLKVGASLDKAFTVKHDAGWFVRYVEFASQPGSSGVTFSVPGVPPGTFDDPCGASPTATTCTMTARFAPRAIGSQSSTMQIDLCSTTDYTFCTTLSSSVTGNGLSPATLSTHAIAFGNVQTYTGTGKSFKVTMDPGWHLALAATGPVPGSQGGAPIRFQVPPAQSCPVGAASCYVAVTYSPTTPGPDAAEVEVIVCNDAQLCLELLPRISLSGTGTLTATKTVVKPGATTVVQGHSITFTGTVTPAPTYMPNQAPDRGTMTFYDGKTVLCSAVPVDANGIATCSAIASGATGLHSITATFSGNAIDKPSTSGPASIRVTSS